MKTGINIFRPGTRETMLFMVLGSLFVVLPIAGDFLRDFDGTMLIFLAVSCCLLLMGVRMTCITRLSVTGVDVFFMLYLLYGVIRLGVPGNVFHEPVVLCEWIGLVAIYMLVRNMRRELIGGLYRFIGVGGVLQALVGIFQYHGLFLVTNDGAFRVTGSFLNPGPYGGFLALGLVVGFCGYGVKDGGKAGLVFRAIGILLISYALILSDSRAAWVAVCIALGMKLLEWCMRRGWMRPVYMKLIFIVALVFFLGTIYFYKQESADVRLLTWNSSALMFRDAPVTGHGIGSFSARYMPYQARFLDSHPDGEYARIANNNLVAFNEYIRLACEQGGVGLLLFALLLGAAFIGSGNSRESATSASGLVCLAVFACFSYPASVFPLKVFFPMFLGVLGRLKRPLWQFRFARLRVFAGGVALLLVCIWFNGRTCLVYRYAFDALEEEECLANPVVRDAGMARNKCFLYLLSERLLRENRLEAALAVKQQLRQVAPTSSLLCDIGMIHVLRHEMDSASGCFEFARRMTPNHVLPAYGLFRVAREIGDRERGVVLASEIVNMPVRVVNNMVLRARKEARDYLAENE